MTHSVFQPLSQNRALWSEPYHILCANAIIPQLYAKLLLNPFYSPGSRIENADFDARVKQAARRTLGASKV